MKQLVLVINPGSTSTKVAVFAENTPIFAEAIRHSDQDLACFAQIMDQEAYRRDCVLAALGRWGQRVDALAAIIGRGGLLRPVAGGVYQISDLMLADLRACRYGAHASNLGAILAHELACPVGIPALIADPVVVDELSPLARYSGHPDIKRRSIFHALNHKAVARRAAQELGQPYDQMRLVVAHLGGGISVGAHENGQVVDVNNALDGDGPFSPERSGGLPAAQLVDWCFAPGACEDNIRKRITGQGGLRAYLGISSAPQIRERMVQGNAAAREAFEALAYQVAKEIGAMGAVLAGQVDAIILTGGLAHDDFLMEQISRQVRFMAPILIYPGEDEMQALALAAFRVLNGQEPVLPYL